MVIHMFSSISNLCSSDSVPFSIPSNCIRFIFHLALGSDQSRLNCSWCTLNWLNTPMLLPHLLPSHKVTQVYDAKLSIFFNSGDHQHLSIDQSSSVDCSPVKPCLQCLGTAAVRCLSRWNKVAIPSCPHPSVPLPFPSHELKGNWKTMKALNFG